MISTDGYSRTVTLQSTTQPPMPPAPEAVIPREVGVKPVQLTELIPTMNGPEKYGYAFFCATANGHRTTEGPRLPPRDEYVEGKGEKTLVIVEDPSQSGYLKWYWIYIQ